MVRPRSGGAGTAAAAGTRAARDVRASVSARERGGARVGWRGRARANWSRPSGGGAAAARRRGAPRPARACALASLRPACPAGLRAPRVLSLRSRQRHVEAWAAGGGRGRSSWEGRLRSEEVGAEAGRGNRRRLKTAQQEGGGSVLHSTNPVRQMVTAVRKRSCRRGPPRGLMYWSRNRLPGDLAQPTL